MYRGVIGCIPEGSTKRIVPIGLRVFESDTVEREALLNPQSMRLLLMYMLPEPSQIGLCQISESYENWCLKAFKLCSGLEMSSKTPTTSSILRNSSYDIQFF